MYPELSQLETLGVARRGYFVEGLGGAQFALPGAVERRARIGADEDAADRARRGRSGPAVRRRPAVAGRAPRTAVRRGSPGAYVVLVGGEPILYLERGGRGLQTLVAADDPRIDPALVALVEQVRAGRIKRLALEKVDGESALASPLGSALVALGFQQGPRRLTLSA